MKLDDSCGWLGEEYPLESALKSAFQRNSTKRVDKRKLGVV
jgi:hypothetical protein